MSLNSHEADIAYQRGFHDGFIKGQEEAIKITSKILHMQPGQSISVQFKDEEAAKRFIQQFKNSNNEGREDPKEESR